MKESLASERRRRFDHGRHQTGSTPGKINAGNRLIDLEWPPLACLGVNMVPVVQAKRHVAVLLNLEYYGFATQSVNCSSRYENAVAGLWSEAYEVVGHRLISDCPPQVFCRVPGFKPA